EDAVAGRGVRAHHAGIARLDRHERLEDRGGGGVGGGDDRGHDAHRLRELDDPCVRVLAQDPHRAQRTDVVVDVHRREEVLGGLVLRVAEARLLVGEASQTLGLGAGGFRHCAHDPVHLLLREFLEGLGRLLRAGGEAPRLLDREEVRVLDGHGLLGGGGRYPAVFLPLAGADGVGGRIFSTSWCGRGITCTETSSPTRRAAAAPASVAAFTAPTSPRTCTVTYPAPMYSLPTRRTLAVLTMASAASMAPTRPLVSTMPSASMAIALSFFAAGAECSTLTPCAPIRYCSRVCPTSIAHSSFLTGDFQMQLGRSGWRILVAAAAFLALIPAFNACRRREPAAVNALVP